MTFNRMARPSPREKDMTFGSRFTQLAVALTLTLGLLAAPLVSAAQASETDKGNEDEGGFFSDLKEGVVELKDKAAAQVPDVPTGAVVAFNRETCPLGWREFPPAVGRVVMGAGDLSGDATIVLMQIDDPSEAAAASDKDSAVSAGVAWLGLLYCDKE
jgi:hypothetical protein